MNIVILGAGAMGTLFGSNLSTHNKVWLVEINKQRAEYLAANGVRIREPEGSLREFRPKVITSTAGMSPADLVIVFVKSMFTEDALRASRNVIGPNTYLMTLQNGTGHEEKLLGFADEKQIIIGTTQHNSSVLSEGYINHGGGGKTSIGLLSGDQHRLQTVAQAFRMCGFDCAVCENIKQQIWQKLFLNTAASSLTALLQVPLSYILENPYACSLMETLAGEAVAVCNAEGYASFDAQTVIADIKSVLSRSKGGYTSIYADIRSGVKTEVDTISGSVVRLAHRLGIPAPYHEMTVALIHAMEGRRLSRDGV